MDVSELGVKVDPRDAEIGSRKVNRATDSMARNAQRSSRKFSGAIGGIGRSLSSLLRTMSLVTVAAGTLGAGLSFTGAIAEAKSFNASLAEVSTLIDDGDFLDDINKQAFELSKTFATSPVDQTKAFYQAISAGASDSASAMDVMTAANKLAVGGVTQVETAIDGLTTILNAYGDRAGSAADISDTLFTGMKAGKTTIGLLSSSLGQVVPIASSAGIAFEELVAGTAALTTQGLATSEAITSLRGIIAAVIKPTADATKMAEKLGIQFDVSALKSMGLASFLSEVIDKTGGSEDQLGKLFGRVEALNGVLAFAGGGGSKFNAILDEMTRKAGATETALKKITDSDAFKFDKALNDIKLIGVELGSVLLPHIVSIAQAASNALTAFNAMLSSLKSGGNLGEALKTAALLFTARMLNGIFRFIDGIRSALPSIGKLILNMIGENIRQLFSGQTLSLIAETIMSALDLFSAGFVKAILEGGAFLAATMMKAWQELRAALPEWLGGTNTPAQSLSDLLEATRKAQRDDPLLGGAHDLTDTVFDLGLERAKVAGDKFMKSMNDSFIVLSDSSKEVGETFMKGFKESSDFIDTSGLQSKLDTMLATTKQVTVETDNVTKAASGAAQVFDAINEKTKSTITNAQHIAIELSKLQAAATAIEGNPFLLTEEKNSRLLANYDAQINKLLQLIALDQKRLDTAIGTEQEFDLTNRINENLIKVEELRNSMATLDFSGGFQAAMTSWLDSFGTTATMTADIITGTLDSAINATTQSINGLIDGTMSWRDAFSNVGRAILQTLQQMIIRMIIAKTLQASLSGFTGGASTAIPLAHTGGVVGGNMNFKRMRKFHTGGVSHDERVVTVREGESILTPEQMRATGGRESDGSEGSPEPRPVQIINVLDPSVVQEALARDNGAAVMNVISRQRKVVKEMVR